MTEGEDVITDLAVTDHQEPDVRGVEALIEQLSEAARLRVLTHWRVQWPDDFGVPWRKEWP